MTLRILVFFAAFTTVSAAHADVCRYAKVSTDRITNASSLTQAAGGITLNVQDGTADISFPVSLGGLNDVEVPAGTEVLMVLKDGTRITFLTSTTAEPTGMAVATQYSAAVYSTWRLKMALSPEAAHAAAESPPVAMRYSIGKQEMKPDFSTSTGDKLQLLFACAANNLTAPGSGD